jgi:rare lipoprotein A
MYAMTAAHQTLPFDSRVQVTNLENKKKTIVRINDRGPFVDGRIIDLSLAAAKDIDMVAPGTAPVRLKLLPTRALAKGQSARYTVQVGFFEEKENAVRLQAQLKSGYPKSAIVPASDGGFRVQVGEMDTRSEAEKAQQRLQKDGFAGFVRLLGK